MNSVPKDEEALACLLFSLLLIFSVNISCSTQFGESTEAFSRAWSSIVALFTRCLLSERLMPLHAE